MKEYLNYDYISFDIFDTLVNRNITNPNKLFNIVEIKSGCKDFKTKRIKAQKEAYINTKKEEITIDDIYNELEKYYTKKTCNKLKEIEKETEINICTPNKRNIKLYNEIIKNKKVIITSDIYLDEDTIIKILKKCNIKNYYKLYISSKIGKRKSRGNLYKHIKKQLKTKKILHIGDNLISDILLARINGLKTKKINIKKNNNFYNRKNKTEEYKELQNFISNGLEEDYYYNFGYECFGPILYSFSKWLTENIKTEKKFFLARDGYLIQKAYNLYNNINEDHYLYASRRSLIVPTLWMENNIKDMLDKLYIRDNIKIGNLFRKFGLENEEFEKIVNKYGYKIDTELEYAELFTDSTFKKIFKEIKPIIDKNSKHEYELLKKYLEQEGFNDDVSIIDIGWNGNMQVALKNINKSLKRNNEIYGYYIGILPESKNLGKVKMNGFLFDEKSNYDIYICLKVINSIFESLFLAPHGSVKKFKRDGKIKPVLYEYEYDKNIEQKYKNIQDGALKFIEEYKKTDLNKIISFSKNNAFSNMEKFAYYPKLIDTKMFGNFKFLEDDIIYIAKPKKIRYYIVHPKQLFIDIYKAGWVIGFMKRLTKINLLYAKIYKTLIKKYLKKRGKKI